MLQKKRQKRAKIMKRGREKCRNQKGKRCLKSSQRKLSHDLTSEEQDIGRKTWQSAI